MTADVSELEALGRDLERAGALASREARQVVARGALNVKRDWRANAQASSGRHAPRYPYSITYDTRLRRGAWEAEIGPDKRRPQGALGNLLEFGSVHNPPHMDGARALAAEMPRFLVHMRAVADRSLQ